MYPIQSLSNMEYALYGNTPSFGNSAVPSMMNGYQAASPYLTTYPNYNMYNSLYSMPNNSIYSQPAQAQKVQIQQTQPQVQSANVSFQSDIDRIADFYNKSSQPSESLASAAIGGAAFGIINNPRLIAHPINSIRSLKKTGEAFKGVKEAGTNINKLWIENNGLMREAYFRLNKVEARNNTKLGLFRKGYVSKRHPEAAKEYDALKPIIENLKNAMNKGDAEGVAKATAQLKVAYTNNGPLSKVGGWFKKLVGKTPNANTVEEALKDTAAINKASADILAKSGKDLVGKGWKVQFKHALKHGGGIAGGLFFMVIEFLMGLGNIKEAFSKDKKTGMAQVGQTLVKGAGSAAGWAIGEAAGVMAATKLCAAAGTAIAPGVGTAIGGIIGLVGGSIGCWLTGKLTKALVGQDVGEKVKLEKMKQTPEGQVQLLQLTAQQKDIPLDVQQSMQNVINHYTNAA